MKPSCESAPAPPTGNAGELIADLPSPRRPVTAVVLALWLVGWALGFVFLLQNLLQPAPFGADRLFLLAWMALWGLAGPCVVVYMGWLVAGRERVFIRGGSLVLDLGVWGLWWTRRWPLESIRRLRAFGREIPPVIAMSLDVTGRGASGVRFEVHGRVVRFARSLREEDARAVVNRLRARHDFDREPHGGQPVQPPSHSAA